ncbi:hypothetical protein J1N35_025197 [Gossypium stocksii]|uniref:Uncharacterized protein n=1 Tax=Gossypium stocksii TaxID=47602 RepID=A0A9D3V634_9ROSI|nr:hypothetical protein J1N35_025197 [Gossypium stocksii]
MVVSKSSGNQSKPTTSFPSTPTASSAAQSRCPSVLVCPKCLLMRSFNLDKFTSCCHSPNLINPLPCQTCVLSPLKLALALVDTVLTSPQAALNSFSGDDQGGNIRHVHLQVNSGKYFFFLANAFSNSFFINVTNMI